MYEPDPLHQSHTGGWRPILSSLSGTNCTRAAAGSAGIPACPILCFLSSPKTQRGYLGNNKVHRSRREGTESYSDGADFSSSPLCPFYCCQFCLGGKKKSQANANDGGEKKALFFFLGWGVNAIGRLLCEEMPGGTIYQRKYNAPRLKLMIAI